VRLALDLLNIINLPKGEELPTSGRSPPLPGTQVGEFISPFEHYACTQTLQSMAPQSGHMPIRWDNPIKHKVNLKGERTAKERYQFEMCRVGNWKKENTEVKAVKYKGKCNTHFLRPSFLRRSKTRVAKINIKDREDPMAPWTSDNDVMAENFHKFYKDLYKKLEINWETLRKLRDNVDTMSERMFTKLIWKANKAMANFLSNKRQDQTVSLIYLDIHDGRST
jgi:hypothetical protein